MTDRPTVFVHGNPETAAIWTPLLAELDRADVICLSPPGFGAPLPRDFRATVRDYRDWLIGQLEGFDTPVDLVGHDWGGGHVVNVAMTRPDLLHSWATDVSGVFDPDYVWHEFARRWQTPQVGEALVARQMGGTLEQRAAFLVGRGVPELIARAVAAGQGAMMGRAILALYRSAAQPTLADLGRDLRAAAQRPGLCILATGDQMVGTDEQRRRSAARAGARLEVLDGLGHWWLAEDPARGAQVLRDFWASLDDPAQR